LERGDAYRDGQTKLMVKTWQSSKANVIYLSKTA
jgi:hypothetical protein